jgi:hypothetical protein
MEDDDVTTSSIFDVEQLPSSFKTFLKENDIDPSVYTVSNLPRYVRVNSQAKDKPTLAQLKEQLKTDDIEQMEHMDGFFRIQLKNTSLRISDMKA